MNDRCRIIVADVMDGLAQIKSETVQCVVTSPPYWGLRDYGTVGLVALGYDRRFVGIELNPEYAAMAERRMRPALLQEVIAF